MAESSRARTFFSIYASILSFPGARLVPHKYVQRPQSAAVKRGFVVYYTLFYIFSSMGFFNILSRILTARIGYY
jgi:hypothetical protein